MHVSMHWEIGWVKEQGGARHKRRLFSWCHQPHILSLSLTLSVVPLFVVQSLYLQAREAFVAAITQSAPHDQEVEASEQLIL